jgi:hypothetical protein
MRNTEELAEAVRGAFAPAHCEIQVAKDDTMIRYYLCGLSTSPATKLPATRYPGP